MINYIEKTLDELGTVGRGKSKHRPRDAAFLYGGQYPFIHLGLLLFLEPRPRFHPQNCFLLAWSEKGGLQRLFCSH